VLKKGEAAIILLVIIPPSPSSLPFLLPHSSPPSALLTAVGNNCSGGGCGGCGGCGSWSGGGKDGEAAIILLVIVAIIVAIFVIIGLIFGSILTFLLINKITKRHLDILQKKSDAKKLVVADLDDPGQVAMAREGEGIDYEGLVEERREENEKRGEDEFYPKKEKVHM
jgi:hypothetical protein